MTAAARGRGTSPEVRHGERLPAVDAADRVRLFAREDAAGHRFWYPPGGGREPGEDWEATPRRERREETGLEAVAVTPPPRPSRLGSG